MTEMTVLSLLMLTCPFFQTHASASLHPSGLRSGVESTELPIRLWTPNPLRPSITQNLLNIYYGTGTVLDAGSAALTEVPALVEYSLAGETQK